jgi:glycosyltransferase 2 family protein
VTTDQAAPEAATLRPRWRWLGRAVRVLTVPLVVLAGVLAVAALIADRHAVAAAFGRLSTPALVAAALCAIVVPLAAAAAWLSLARGLGVTARIGVLSRVFFVGQLGKYLPGPAWPAVLQGSLGTASGQAPESTAGAALACLVITPALGVPMGLALVLGAAPGRAGALLWLLVPALAPLALLHPAVLGRLLGMVARITGRRAPARSLPAGVVVRAVVAQGVAWLALGAQSAVLASGVGSGAVTVSGARLAVLAAGAGVLAYNLGMFAIVAPAGLGVREGALVLLLGPVLGVGPAAAVALAARLLNTLLDLLYAAVAGAIRAPAASPASGPGSSATAARAGGPGR